MVLQYDFTDRVALITGGSQGIGAGVAAAVVQAGAAVAITAGTEERLEKTAVDLKHEIPAMLNPGGDVIINMAPVAGVTTTSNLSAYVSGKAGIIGLSRSATLDYVDQGIRINVIAPGPILTDDLRAAGDRAQQLAAESVPLGRIGSTADVAACVLWLSSEDASFITGVTIPVDGGQTVGTKLRHTYRPGKPMD